MYTLFFYYAKSEMEKEEYLLLLLCSPTFTVLAIYSHMKACITDTVETAIRVDTTSVVADTAIL